MKSDLVKSLLESNTDKQYKKLGSQIDTVLKAIADMEKELKKIRPKDDMLERILKEMRDSAEQFKRMNL